MPMTWRRRAGSSPVPHVPWASSWGGKGMAKKGKRLRANAEGIDRTKHYCLEEALELLRERANAKFDETIELSPIHGIERRNADQADRGVANLRDGTGQS